MKKAFLLAVILTIFVIASGTSYALPGLTVDAAVAPTVPMGDFSDAAKPGFAVAGEAFIPFGIIPGLKIGIRAAYNHFGMEESDEENYTMIEILPSVRFSFSPPMSPLGIFGQVGVGLYNFNSSIENFDSQNEVGVNIGAGLTQSIAPLIKLFVMPQYHLVMTEEENTTYLTVNIGVMF
ncbi:hypothetical protein ACFL1R_02795 [Candidatus Latescibacterota bacterium]